MAQYVCSPPPVPPHGCRHHYWQWILESDGWCQELSPPLDLEPVWVCQCSGTCGIQVQVLSWLLLAYWWSWSPQHAAPRRMGHWKLRSGNGKVPEANAKSLAHPPEESLCPLLVEVVWQGLLPGSGLQRSSDGCVLTALSSAMWGAWCKRLEPRTNRIVVPETRPCICCAVCLIKPMKSEILHWSWNFFCNVRYCLPNYICLVQSRLLPGSSEGRSVGDDHAPGLPNKCLSRVTSVSISTHTDCKWSRILQTATDHGF